MVFLLLLPVFEKEWNRRGEGWILRRSLFEGKKWAGGATAAGVPLEWGVAFGISFHETEDLGPALLQWIACKSCHDSKALLSVSWSSLLASLLAVWIKGRCIYHISTKKVRNTVYRQNETIKWIPVSRRFTFLKKNISKQLRKDAAKW